MKLIAAFNILDRRRGHLLARMAKSRSELPDKPTAHDEREVAALTVALDVLDEQFSDKGSCKCNGRGRCGFCRTKTIPELRARLLEAERLIEEHRIDAGALPERSQRRLRLSYELSQLRGLRDDMRLGHGGLTFTTVTGHFWASAPADEGHRDALMWLGRNRRHLLDILGRPAE